MMTKRCALY